MKSSMISRPDLRPVQALNDFCASLRDNPSCALDALLKIAEAKQAILDWKQELSTTHAKDVHERNLKFIAVEHAMSLVDSAEESILDAFCLYQKERSRSNRLGVKQKPQSYKNNTEGNYESSKEKNE